MKSKNYLITLQLALSVYKWRFTLQGCVNFLGFTYWFILLSAHPFFKWKVETISHFIASPANESQSHTTEDSNDHRSSLPLLAVLYQDTFISLIVLILEGYILAAQNELKIFIPRKSIPCQITWYCHANWHNIYMFTLMV